MTSDRDGQALPTKVLSNIQRKLNLTKPLKLEGNQRTAEHMQRHHRDAAGRIQKKTVEVTWPNFIHSPQDHAVGKEVYRLREPRDSNWKQALALLKAWNKKYPWILYNLIIQSFKSIGHNIVVTQLIHPRLREHCGRGCGKTVGARGPGCLLWGAAFWTWQGCYNHAISALWLPI